MTYSPDQLTRLAKNYHAIAPRLDTVINEFLTNIHEELDQSADWTPPTTSDHERLVELISQLGQSFDDPDQIVDESDSLETMLNDYRYIAIRESFLSAIATVSDYTWTAQLREDWITAFDLVPNMLIVGTSGKLPAAAA